VSLSGLLGWRGRLRLAALVSCALALGFGLGNAWAQAEPSPSLEQAGAGASASESASEAEQPSEVPIEVVVHGSPQAPVRELRDPTVATYVIRGDPLRSPGLGSADALGRVPGVQPSRSGTSTDLATAQVRGATSAQTPIYLGGIRLNDDLTGSVDLSAVPLWMLDRVEVYRGNAPLDADAFGIGGAIRFEPRLPRRPETGLGVGLGSFGERELSLLHARAGADGAALLAVRLHRTEGDFEFQHDGGTAFDPSDDRTERRQNADATSVDVWTVGRYRLGERGRVTVLLNGLSREAGAPGLQLIGARKARAELRRLLGGVSARLVCSAGCELELVTGALDTDYRLSDPFRELGSAAQTQVRGQRLTERLRLRLLPLEGLRLGLGGLQELQRLGVAVDRTPSLRARRLVSRLDLSAELDPWEPLTLVGAAALECHTTRAHGIEASADQVCGVLEPAGRLGLRARLSAPLSLFGNLGRYVRVPTLGELYGISAVVRGNPELEPETGLSADLGATVTGGVSMLEGYAQLVGFVRFSRDLIGYRRSSLGVIRPYNIADARVLGLELAAGGTAWQVVRAGLSLTALDPRDTSEDRQVESDLLPFQARLVLAPELELSTPEPWQAISLDRASLLVRYFYRSSRVADPAGLVLLGEQGQLDLEASLWWHAERLRLRGRLANLIDQRSVDLVGFPLPGRSAYLSMEAWW